MAIEIKRERFANGQLECETPYNKGQKHGIVKYWYYNGQLECETPYLQGQRHGITKWWWKNGQLNREYYHLYDKEVTQEEYQAQSYTIKTSSEVVCLCGKKTDIGSPCWWCGGKN